MDAGTLLGPYAIERELGSGGMGKVFAATVTGRSPGLAEGARVALKVMHPHLLETSGFFQRFLREGEIGQVVRHANVVRTFGCDQVVVDGTTNAFLVMEYVEGQTLRDLLDELGRVSEGLCRHIGREVCKGLAAIHAAGVIHRDIKPDNVLLTEDHVVKVMDLGVARHADDMLRLSQTGAFVGSLHYAAPEAFREGGQHVDGRADLHALGVVLYELSGGTNPYLADDVAQTVKKVLHETPRRLGEINPQLSPFFEEVVHCLLAKKPDERFADAGELLGVLEAGEDSAWWRSRASTIRTVTRRPLRRVRIPRETAVYGRESELATLRELFDAARSGEGNVVVIQGEAGIGKSRLVDELIRALHSEREDINFLFGSYPPGQAATAAGGFSTAYREQFGEFGCGEFLATTPVLVPAFDALLRGEPTPEGAEPLTKDSLQTCFVNATRALATERPTVVLIDDLHFAPDEGRALFTSVAMSVPGHRVLLIGTARPGVSEEWTAGMSRLDHASQLELRRLGAKDLVALLQDTLKSKRLTREVGDQIALKSDGNPFFVFEILRGLREAHLITEGDDGSWASTGVIEKISIPSTVIDLVNARVADLNEEDRELLDVACCWGFEFDPEIVAEAAGLELLPALKRLARIERAHRLIRASGRRYVFDHHQVQEALYEGLFQLLREQYHLRIASALEARGTEGADAVLVCRHFFHGGRGERGLPHVEVALDHLEQGYLNEELVDLADRALALPELVGESRLELLLRKARAVELMGRPDAELATLTEACALAEVHGDPALQARAESALGWHLTCVSRHEEAEEVLRRAIVYARSAGDRKTEALAEGNLASLMWRTGRREEEVAQRGRQLALAREIGYRRGEASAIGGLGIRALEDARYDDAFAHFAQQLAVARELGDRGLEAQAVGNQGVARWRQGRLAEARTHFEADLELSRQRGHRRGEGLALGHLGNVHSRLGHHEEALEYIGRFLVVARETGDRRGEANALGNLGSVLFTLGRTAEALEYHVRFEELSRGLGQAMGEAVALHNQGETWAVLGQPARARELVERGLERAKECGLRILEVHAPWVLGHLAAAEGNDAGAAALLEEAAALARELGIDDALAGILASLGSHLGAHDRHEEARVHLEEALALGRATGSPGPAVLAACRLALLPGGDADRARNEFEEQGAQLDHDEAIEARFLMWQVTGEDEHLTRAHELLEVLRANAPAVAAESTIASVPLHRDIVAAWNQHRDG